MGQVAEVMTIPWVATPSPYSSFLCYTTPVYPGAPNPVTMAAPDLSKLQL